MGLRLMENSSFMESYVSKDPSLGPSKYLNLEERVFLGELLAVLQPFYDTTQLWQATDRVSLSLVYPAVLRLMEIMEIERDIPFNVPTPAGVIIL